MTAVWDVYELLVIEEKSQHVILDEKLVLVSKHCTGDFVLKEKLNGINYLIRLRRLDSFEVK